MNYFKCDVCGKFISYADLESGKASRFMITPDSDYSSERYETLCPKHNPPSPQPQRDVAGEGGR